MRRRGERGFSLIEALMVVSIIMVLSAFAAPQIRTSLQRYQLETKARRVAGLVQIARREAARQNRRMRLGWGFDFTGSGASIVYVDTNRNGLMDQGEQRAVFPFSSGTTPNFFDSPTLPDPDYGDISFSNSTIRFPWGLYFNPDGTLVEQMSFGATAPWQMVTSMKAITVTQMQGSIMRRFAITITPAGGTRLWVNERILDGGWSDTRAWEPL